MTTSRESLVGTLLSKLGDATGVAVATRRWFAHDEGNQEDYPALILMQDRETFDTTDNQVGLPLMKTMQFKVLLYALGDGTENAVPATALNALVDALDTLLAPNPVAGARQNLGIPGVQWVVISGPIEYDGGAYGNVGIAVVPLEVTYS